MSVRLVTFGCRLNSQESDVILENARKAHVENAIIFNTCSVTAEAIRQAKQAIRKARREDREARIVVTGCAAQINPELFSCMDEVDHVIGNEEKLLPQTYHALQAGIENKQPDVKLLVNDIMSIKETAGHMALPAADRTRAFLQVQNGCDHRCTFCIIPYGRGNSRSVPPDIVLRNARFLVEHGYLELVITGVDITSYGHDLQEGLSLGNLVQLLLRNLPALKRLRISSIDSVEADDALLSAFAEEDRLMPHIHLSLQAGDDLTLKRMKRRHSRADSIHFCEQLRRLRSDIVFGADVIAGFPTETEAMFANSLSIIDECELTFLHVFPFSAHAGTPASRMPQLPKSLIRERAARLREKGHEALLRYLTAQKGATAELLLETDSLGRTPQYAPVLLHDNPQNNMIPGSFLKTIVTGHTETALLARCIP